MKPATASIFVTFAFSIGAGIVIGLCIPDFPQPDQKGAALRHPSEKPASATMSAADCEERLETRAYEVTACSDDLHACYREKERCEDAVESDRFLQAYRACNEDLQQTKLRLDTCIQNLSKD